MAFKTLDQLRTSSPGLNTELGLTADTDNSFGSSADRNSFIQRAIAKLWPRMGRLTRETFVTVTQQVDYSLTSLVDVERLEIVDKNTGTLISDHIRSWQHYLDETGDPPTNRLLIPSMQAGQTIRAIGYVPYVIPSTGSTNCDIPPRLEHVVIAGARVEAYRAKVNSFANYERYQNENRQNALSAADVLELLRQSQREFDRALAENARNLTGAHRARLQTTG